MKKIVIYVCSIIISLLVLTSCASKPSNTPGATASSETVDSSLREKKSADSTTENVPVESEVSSEPASIPEEKVFSYILPEGSTLESRFAVPDGYVRSDYPEGSFGSFVRNYPMKPDGSPVLLWTKEPKGKQ